MFSKFKTADYIAMVAVVVPFCIFAYFQPLLALIVALLLSFTAGFAWLMTRLND